MKPAVSHIVDLYWRSQTEMLAADEQQEWERFQADYAKEAAHLQLLGDELQTADRFLQYAPAELDQFSEQLLGNIKERIDFHSEPSAPGRLAHRVHFLKTAWVRYAAAIIILFGIGAYLWNTQQKEKPLITDMKPVPVKNDITPGSNKAMLTLSDGRKVELTPETKSIAEAGINIQNQNGKLEYGKADKVVFNTMSTPRGGQYQLTLPDGTNVWLNAASSITYPTAFVNNSREVTITGEAYFEVAKNKAKPFKVNTRTDRITVLGTAFNIQAYPDEASMKTSLVEGSVKIANAVLKPGQAYINGKIVLTNIDHDVAWKTGMFNFEEADVKTVMRQIARWYDVEIVYEGEIPATRFVGEMTRNINLSGVLDILKAAGVKFRLEEGRKLIVTR
jgi:transmembrane sensor